MRQIVSLCNNSLQFGQHSLASQALDSQADLTERPLEKPYSINPNTNRYTGQMRSKKPLCETPLAPTSMYVPPNSGTGAIHRPPQKLPDPWLFDSEALLRELDRCREMVLLIPAPTHETHFAINNAIDSIWNLREQLRYLLSLHRDGQRAFAQKAATAKSRPTVPNVRTKATLPARA